MAQQTINIGSAPDDGTGDTLRDGGDKINDNFTELYTDKADKAGGTFTGDIIVPDEAYDATAWNGSLEVPTKNAVRDKIESLGSGITELDDIPDVNAPTPSNGDVLTWDSTPGEWVSAAPTGGSNALDDLTDVDAPTPSDGDVLTFDSGSGDWVSAAPTSGGTPSGTSFPGSPSTGDKFYRSDRHIEYYYDGTRWLSTQMQSITISMQQSVAPSADFNYYAAIPFKGLYSIYLERFDVSGWRSAAGEWDFLLQHGTGNPGTYTTIATVDGSGHPTTTWFADSATIGAVLTSSCEVFRIVLDEVSGSATLIGAANISFRLVG